MEEATRPNRPSPSCSRRWALPIFFGSAGGLWSVILAMDTLVDYLGEMLGGGLAGLVGVGLGFGLSVAANLLRPLIGRMLIAESPAASDTLCP
jgi:hypothetical protein